MSSSLLAFSFKLHTLVLHSKKRLCAVCVGVPAAAAAAVVLVADLDVVLLAEERDLEAFRHHCRDSFLSLLFGNYDLAAEE